MQYFKLNFLDGKIIEAKAYLEQSPYILHRYFKNYDRPPYVEFILKNEENSLPVGTALKYLYDCEYNRVRRINFLGDTAGYEHLDRLLAECKESGLFTSIELSDKVTRKQLKDMINDGASEFVTEIENISALKLLQELGFAEVRAKWFMDGENFRELKQKVEIASSLGVKELIITGMKPARRSEIKKSIPSREALEQTANFIKDYEKNPAQMKLSVEPCFSVLRAFMGGAEVRRNPNRGIERGCTAGRDHFCITSTGKFSPCSLLCDEDSGRIGEYWEKTPALEKLRAMEENRPSPCKGCRYERRCLPCPSLKEKISDCPISQ
jgi:radical SAM protein with 4Fe4S-binding SPASM domain